MRRRPADRPDVADANPIAQIEVDHEPSTRSTLWSTANQKAAARSPSEPPANTAAGKSRQSPRRLASPSPAIIPAATSMMATEASRGSIRFAGALPMGN